LNQAESNLAYREERASRIRGEEGTPEHKVKVIRLAYVNHGRLLVEKWRGWFEWVKSKIEEERDD
jgi:hypothetical protein